MEQEARRAAEDLDGPRRPRSRTSGGPPGSGRAGAVAAAAATAVTALAIAEVEEDLESSLKLLQSQVNMIFLSNDKTC